MSGDKGDNKVGDASNKQQSKKNDGRRTSYCIRESVSSDGKVAELFQAKPKHHKYWNRRFKFACCCLGYKRNKESLSEVASLFAEYFADLKLQTSEIAAGMVLLSKFQAAQQEYMVRTRQNEIQQILSNVPIKAETKFLDLSKAEHSHLVNDMMYYINYSLAIFGWPLQMFEDPCSAFQIYPHLKWSLCCACFRRRRQPAHRDSSSDENNNNNHHQKANKTQPHEELRKQADMRRAREEQKKRKPGIPDAEFDPIVEEDNCCSCNWASAEQRLDDHNFEIVYITYQSDVGVVPFLVAADHAKETIVVAIRGSMNLSDVITDMLGSVDAIPIENCPEGWLGHRGMTRAALYVKNKLINERILERAFNCNPDWGSKDYSLLLCGHSLGAGVASILGILLRPTYPKLRAYLYSPPGGILSLPVVNQTKEFAVGIILGNDVVARLGLAQFERFRYQLLLAMKSADRSTCRVLTRALCPSSCCGDNDVEYDPDQSVDLLQATSGRSFEFGGIEIPFQSTSSVLYVPGRLIHIVRNHGVRMRRSSVSSNKKAREPIYQAIWSTDNSIYDRVIFCDNMFMDHMPNRLMGAMRMLFIRTLPDRRDSVKPTVQRLPSQADDGDASTSHDGAGDQKNEQETKNDGKNSLPNADVIDNKDGDNLGDKNSAQKSDKDMYPISEQPTSDLDKQVKPIGFVPSNTDENK